jgi:cytochrome P450
MNAVPKQPIEVDVDEWAVMAPGASAGRWDLYHRLRHESPRLKHRDRIFLATYEDCRYVLSSAVQFVNGIDRNGASTQAIRAALDPARRSRFDAVIDHQQRWMTSRNGASHAELRGLANRVFTPRAIADMQDRIQREVEMRLQELAQRESVDIVAEFAYQLPMTIISEMLDIPMSLQDGIHRAWLLMTGIIGADASRIPDVIDDAYAGMMDLEIRMREVIELRRRSETTDLFARLLRAIEDPGCTATESDIVAIVTQMVIAGHQTTQDTIGSALYELLSNREQWQALVADSTLIPNAVEEVLRFRSPAQMIERTAASRVCLDDFEISAGERVVCLLASANRDEKLFANSEVFDIRRENARQHLGFSRGIHFCLGAALSRMEAISVLSTLTRLYPNTKLLERDVRWTPNRFLLGVEALKVALSA